MGKNYLALLSSDGQQALDIFMTDPFHYFNMNGLASDPVMQGTAASLFQMLQVFGIAVLAISTLCGVIMWGITPPAKKKEGIVSVLGWKLFVAMFIGAFIEIVGLIYIIYDRMAAQVGPS